MALCKVRTFMERVFRLFRLQQPFFCICMAKTLPLFVGIPTGKINRLNANGFSNILQIVVHSIQVSLRPIIGGRPMDHLGHVISIRQAKFCGSTPSPWSMLVIESQKCKRKIGESPKFYSNTQCREISQLLKLKWKTYIWKNGSLYLNKTPFIYMNEFAAMDIYSIHLLFSRCGLLHKNKCKWKA